MTKQLNLLDLDKVKDVIFSDINQLLDSFNLEYECYGTSIFMRCPIHEGSDNNRALSISTDLRSWRCWTRGCHETYHTDVFGFTKGVLSQEKEASFSDVLKHVCKVYDISSVRNIKTTKKQDSTKNEFNNCVKIFNANQTKIVSNNIERVNTCGESPYFISRGFNQKTLDYFGIEDCTDKTSTMKHRAIIPVHCDSGVEIAYIARSTKDYITPKYLFSKNFRKSDYLYNYHRAIESAIQTSCLFLVEGQGDVWRLYETGVNNCMGLFGKDISQQQKTKLIRSGVTTLVILTDNDQAGRESKVKIQRSLNRIFSLKFPRMSRKDIGDMSVQKIKEEILPQTKGLYR